MMELSLGLASPSAEGAPAAAALSVKERRKTFKVKLKKVPAVVVEKKTARLK